MSTYMITITQRHTQTNRRTDRRTTCLGNTALRVASRGKYGITNNTGYKNTQKRKTSDETRSTRDNGNTIPTVTIELIGPK